MDNLISKNYKKNIYTIKKYIENSTTNRTSIHLFRISNIIKYKYGNFVHDVCVLHPQKHAEN